MTEPMKRIVRSRHADPSNVPRSIEGEADLITIDTTWGELQPIEPAPGVLTVGELELAELVAAGAALIDTRVPDSRSGITIPGAVNIAHDEIVDRRDELDPDGTSILFCNGPQCPRHTEGAAIAPRRELPRRVPRLLPRGPPRLG